MRVNVAGLAIQSILRDRAWAAELSRELDGLPIERFSGDDPGGSKQVLWVQWTGGRAVELVDVDVMLPD